MTDAAVGPVRGRDAEVALLDALAREELAPARVVSIVGEAGIGRTRLWSHAVDEQRRAGRRVTVATCSETEAEMPYACLEDLIGELLDEHADRLPGVQRHALDRALLRASDEDGPVDARTVAAGVYALLGAATADAPLVLAVDDVQWLDAETDRCLAFAVRRLERARLLVLLAALDQDPSHGPVVSSRLGETPRSQVLRIGPLDVAAARSMLRDRAGLLPSYEQTRALVSETGGNPRWLAEFAPYRLRTRPDRTDDALPASLHAMAGRGLDGLAPDVVTVASLVAVLGRPRPAVLIRAVRHDGNVGGDIEPLLDRAVTAGVLMLVDGRIVPAHPVVGTALLSALPPFRRRRALWHAAELADSAEERAHHLLRAWQLPGIGGITARDRTGADALLDALDDAAGSAERRGAVVAAARFAERALELDRAARPTERVRRVLRTAELQTRAGGFARARELLDPLELVGLDDDLFERLALALNDTVARTEGGHGLRDLLRRLDDASRAGGTGVSRRRRATVEAVAADRQLCRADRLAVAERAVADAADAAVSPRLLARALSRLVLARIDAGWPARDVLDRLHAVEGSMAVPALESGAVFDGLVAHAEDDLDRAAVAFRVAYRERLDLGDYYLATVAAMMLGVVAHRAGRIPDARAALELTDAASAPNVSVRSIVTTVRAVTGLAAGDLDAVEAALRIDDVDVDDADWLVGTGPDHIRGVLAAERGDHATAARLLGRFVDACTAAGVTDPQMRQIADVELAEACLRTGDLDRAVAVADHLDAVATRTGRASTRGQERRLRAQIALHRDPVVRDGTVLETAQEAVALHPRDTRPVEHGRSLTVLAAVHRRLGDRETAAVLEDRARAAFLDAGDVRYVRRLDDPGRIAHPVATTLTPSERSVAEAVAGGESNREVAQRLQLSVRTVENHLHRVYRKLGIRTRADLGAVLGAAGAGPERTAVRG